MKINKYIIGGEETNGRQISHTEEFQVTYVDNSHRGI